MSSEFNCVAVTAEFFQAQARKVRLAIPSDRPEPDHDDQQARALASSYFDRPADLAQRAARARGKSWVAF